MSNTWTCPVHSAAPGAEKPRFDATNVQVTAARIVCRAGRPVSQSSPLGRSMASFGAAAALSPSITASSGGLGSPRTPVPSRASTIQAAPARLSASRGGIVPAAEDFQWHSDLAEDLEIDPRVALQFLRLGPHQHADRVAPQVEVPGQHEAVAGIIALPAADDDLLPRRGQLAEHVGRAAAGVFHQHQSRYTIFLACAAIDLSGLFAAEGHGGGIRDWGLGIRKPTPTGRAPAQRVAVGMEWRKFGIRKAEFGWGNSPFSPPLFYSPCIA